MADGLRFEHRSEKRSWESLEHRNQISEFSPTKVQATATPVSAKRDGSKRGMRFFFFKAAFIFFSAKHCFTSDHPTSSHPVISHTLKEKDGDFHPVRSLAGRTSAPYLETRSASMYSEAGLGPQYTRTSISRHTTPAPSYGLRLPHCQRSRCSRNCRRNLPFLLQSFQLYRYCKASS